MCEAVLSAVAKQESVPPEKLEPPLYEAIDPDALDSLFRNGTGRVTFEYSGYLVTVDVDCTVELTAVDSTDPVDP